MQVNKINIVIVQSDLKSDCQFKHNWTYSSNKTTDHVFVVIFAPLCSHMIVRSSIYSALAWYLKWAIWNDIVNKLLCHSLRSSSNMSAAKTKKKRQRTHRYTSNVFSMFNQDQIQEFKVNYITAVLLSIMYTTLCYYNVTVNTSREERLHYSISLLSSIFTTWKPVSFF